MSDNRVPSPTEIATATGLAWDRTNPSDLLTWDGLMELAHQAYLRNRYPRTAGVNGAA